VYDAAAWNAVQVEEVSLLDFEQMLVDDTEGVEWDKDEVEGWNQWNDDFELVIWVVTYLLSRSRNIWVTGYNWLDNQWITETNWL